MHADDLLMKRAKLWSNEERHEKRLVFSTENEGRGGPVFNNEEDGCLYIFDWGTKYACLDVELMCWIEQGDVRYDVSSLTRTEDGHGMWNMLTHWPLGNSNKIWDRFAE